MAGRGQHQRNALDLTVQPSSGIARHRPRTWERSSAAGCRVIEHDALVAESTPSDRRSTSSLFGAGFADFAAGIADDVVFEDRRAGLTYSSKGRDELLANIRALDLPIVRVEQVAVRGQFLTLYEVLRAARWRRG